MSRNADHKGEICRVAKSASVVPVITVNHMKIPGRNLFKSHKQQE